MSDNATSPCAPHARPNDRYAVEEQDIRAAIQRLVSGHPEASNGRLSVSALAAEAGVSRQRLYEHHPDLLAEFRTTAVRQAPPVEIAALKQQLSRAHQRIEELEAIETHLADQIKTLCAVVSELTHEAHAHNVIALPRH